MKYLNAFVLLLLLVAACTPDDKDNITPIPVPDIFDNCVGEYNCSIRTVNSYKGIDTTIQEKIQIAVISKTDSTLRIWTDTFRLKSDTTLTLYRSQYYYLIRSDSRFYGKSIFIEVWDRLKSPSKGYILNGNKL